MPSILAHMQLFLLGHLHTGMSTTPLEVADPHLSHFLLMQIIPRLSKSRQGKAPTDHEQDKRNPKQRRMLLQNTPNIISRGGMCTKWSRSEYSHSTQNDDWGVLDGDQV
jgi:hypothetical protein